MSCLRLLGCVFVLFLLSAQPALAQKAMYVTDRMQVIVRIAPAQYAKTIFYVGTGEQVTILEGNNEGWAKVRAADGREGWALARYFMEEPPAALRMKDLDPQSKNLAQKLEEIRKEAQDTKIRLSLAENRAQQAEAAYQKLRADSDDVIRLREDCQKLKEDFQQQGQKLEERAIEDEVLRFSTNLKWFLAGGGVLIIGWIMGLAYGRRKRSWSSSLK
jgi:SH3 domain protein